MEQHGDEEKKCRQQPVGPVRGGREIRQRAREIARRERPCDQSVNHEPAHVDVDRYAADREHTHRPTHGTPLLSRDAPESRPEEASCQAETTPSVLGREACRSAP